MQTIDEAKKFIEENASSGCTCPVCNRPVKIHRRRITDRMARTLILVYQISKKSHWRPVCITEELPQERGSNPFGDYSYLALWHLLQQCRPGYWRITREGANFVEGGAVPEITYELFNRARSYGPKMVTIQKCLGTKFNYGDLMRKD